MGIFVLLNAAIAVAPDQSAAWHLDGWGARAIIEVASRSADADCDTAAVRVLCLGRAKPDGSDYRVLDAAGRPVPFQLAFHDAGRYSLLAFRCAQPGERFFVYFGNADAPAASEQIVVDPTPGAGPPKGSRPKNSRARRFSGAVSCWHCAASTRARADTWPARQVWRSEPSSRQNVA